MFVSDKIVKDFLRQVADFQTHGSGIPRELCARTCLLDPAI